MTEDQLTLIATRIMDRVERDGNGLQLTALVEELRAGLAIVEAQPSADLEVKTGSYNVIVEMPLTNGARLPVKIV